MIPFLLDNNSQHYVYYVTIDHIIGLVLMDDTNFTVIAIYRRNTFEPAYT